MIKSFHIFAFETSYSLQDAIQYPAVEGSSVNLLNNPDRRKGGDVFR